MWILPSHNRPDLCQRALDSVAALAFGNEATEGVVIVDGGEVEAYRNLRLPQKWSIEIHYENIGSLPCLNRYFAQHPQEPWYGFLNDDFIVRTGNWDHRLIAAAGRFGMASCEGLEPDGLSNKRMRGAPCYGGDLVRAVGWLAPSGVNHCFADDAWEAVAAELRNLTRCLDVVVEHRHPMFGSGPLDDTYRKAYAHFEKDRRRWTEFKAVELAPAIQRVREAMIAADPETRIRADRAKSRKVMIATPIAADPKVQYLVSLVQTVADMERAGVHQVCNWHLGSSNLPRARNGLAAQFLASDCDDLIMIDDDMGWNPGAVQRLLASDKPFIGAVGRKRVEKDYRDPSAWCCQLLPGSENALLTDAMGAVQVARFGAAFLKVERSVFERLIAAHPEWKRRGHEDMSEEARRCYYAFFRFDTENDGEDAGEDYMFCDRWRAIGGEVWIDPTIELKHVGMKEYTGRIRDVMQAVAPPQLRAAE